MTSPAVQFQPRQNSVKRKYGNTPTRVDGVLFASKREAKRWGELKLLERAGKITALSRQVTYPLSVNGVLIGKIVPDFVYIRNGRLVVEDVKSDATLTPIFKWKAKHLLAEHGLAIEVVK